MREDDPVKNIIYDALIGTMITALVLLIFKKVRPLTPYEGVGGRMNANIVGRFKNVWEAKYLMGRSALYGAGMGLLEDGYDSLKETKHDPQMLLYAAQKRVFQDLVAGISAWKEELISGCESWERAQAIEQHQSRVLVEMSHLMKSAPQLQAELELHGDEFRDLSDQLAQVKAKLK